MTVTTLLTGFEPLTSEEDALAAADVARESFSLLAWAGGERGGTLPEPVSLLVESRTDLHAGASARVELSTVEDLAAWGASVTLSSFPSDLPWWIGPQAWRVLVGSLDGVPVTLWARSDEVRPEEVEVSSTAPSDDLLTESAVLEVSVEEDPEG